MARKFKSEQNEKPRKALGQVIVKTKKEPNSAYFNNFLPKPGFTLLETIVVLLIMGALLAIPIFSSFITSDWQRLEVSGQEVAQEIRKAQALAQSPSVNLSDYGSFDSKTQKICGFGVHLDYTNNRYLLFADILNITSPLASCTNSDGTPKAGYFSPQSQTSPDLVIESLSPAQGIILKNSPPNSISDVVFAVPYLDTFITLTNSSSHSQASGKAVLFGQTDPSYCKEILVNNSGQVSIQTNQTCQ